MSALHFYQNRQMELFAAKETKRLTLRQLVRIVPVMLSDYRLALLTVCHNFKDILREVDE